MLLSADKHYRKGGLDGVAIAGSPFDVLVEAEPVAASRCLLEGEGLGASVASQTPGRVTIFSRDRKERLVKTGDTAFVVRRGACGLPHGLVCGCSRAHSGGVCSIRDIAHWIECMSTVVGSVAFGVR